MTSTKPDLPTLEAVDRTHSVRADDGVQLSVKDLGPQHAETVILFAHGFTLTSRSWFFQARHLRHTHPQIRLLIPDLRGHGDSVLVHSGAAGNAITTHTDDHVREGAEPAQLSVEATARDLVQILHELAPNTRVVLVGHSMGVMSVLGALRLMSPTQRDGVAGIILINGAIDRFASKGITQILDSAPVRVLRAIGKRMPAKAHIAKSGAEWLIKPVIAAFVYHGALEEGVSSQFDIVDFHADEIDGTSMGTILGYLDDLATHDEHATAPLLEGIPGAVMVGVRDNVTPADQTRKIGALWQGSDVVEFPDSGHMLPVECPEAVNRVIDRVLRQAGLGSGD